MEPDEQPPSKEPDDGKNKGSTEQPVDNEKVAEVVHATAATTADQRIQFAPSVKGDRGRSGRGDSGEKITSARRASSVTSIPHVPEKSERKRREKEEKEGEKHVDIDEHLKSHGEVAARYKTHISMNKPAESQGLTMEQAEQLLREHGPNVLTPPKKRHPFLKYLDCLTSLFNLLLIVAGVLEYILLGIDFKDNFQNVSVLAS